MKKLVVAFATVLATVLVAAVFAGGVAAGGGGKVVAEGFACGILDGSGSIYITNNSELWSYQNRSILRCQGNNGVGADPGPHFFTFAET